MGRQDGIIRDGSRRGRGWVTGLALVLMVGVLSGCFPRTGEQTFHSHLKNGRYQEAYEMVNQAALHRGTTYAQVAMFDLSHVHVKGRYVDHLHCREVYERNPRSFSYAVRLCAILIQYLEEGEVRQERIDAMAEVIEREYRHLRFLVSAAEDLNRLRP